MHLNLVNGFNKLIVSLSGLCQTSGLEHLYTLEFYVEELFHNGIPDLPSASLSFNFVFICVMCFVFC